MCVQKTIGESDTKFNPWIGKSPWRKEWLPTPVFLPGESHGQRGLAGQAAACGLQSQTGLNNSHCHFHVIQVCHSFPSKEPASFNFMTANFTEEAQNNS